MKFSIDLLIPIKKPENTTVSFLKNNLTHIDGEIKSQDYSYTQKEKLEIHKNSQKTLSFSMMKYEQDGDYQRENPYLKSVIIGSLILLTDNFDQQHLFIVTKVNYTLHQFNVEYNYSCEDWFNHQLAHQNEGYTITNDPSSEDFIGAKSIDWWVNNKIAQECYIPYEYIDTTKQLVLNKEAGTLQVYNGYDDNNNSIEFDDFTSKIIKPHYDNFDTLLPFSCSNSNAMASLISLAGELGLMIVSYERLYQVDGVYYLSTYFWFEPEKSNQPSGLMYSPEENIQSLNFSASADNLTTVLNVEPITLNDEVINLFPSLPPFFANIFSNAKEWEGSTYDQGYFQRLLKGKEQNITQETNNYTAYLENKICYIPLDSFINDNYPLFSCYYDNYISYIKIGDKEEINSKDSVFQIYVKYNDDSIRYYNPNEENHIDLTNSDEQGICCAVSETDAISYDLHLKVFKEISQEEQDFAIAADNCPWLENKLIDFSYFITHKIISPAEYKDLWNVLTNDLRILNGKLMFYSKAYYNALAMQVKTLANLDAAVDRLGAICAADIVTAYQDSGFVQDKAVSTFKDQYNSLFQTNITSEQKLKIVNYKEILAQTINQAFDANQRFLKNIKAFKDYFNAPNVFSNVQKELYPVTIKASYPTNGNTKMRLLGFAPFNFDIATEESQSETGKIDWKDSCVINHSVLVPLYHYRNNHYEKLKIVTKDNYKNEHIFISKTLADSWTQINTDTVYNPDNKYYYPYDNKEEYENMFGGATEGREIIIRKENNQEKKYILLNKLDLIKWYIRSNISIFAKDHYVRQPLHPIPFDWIRYVPTIDEENPWAWSRTALKGVYWKTIPVAQDLTKEEDDKIVQPIVEQEYRYTLPLSSIYYYGPLHRVNETSNNIQIEYINERGINQNQWEKQTEDKRGTNPEEFKTLQDIPFISGLPTGPSSISNLDLDAYIEFTNDKKDAFNYFSLCNNSTMWGWGIALMVLGGLVGWSVGTALYLISNDEQNKQWVQKYEPQYYFDPNDQWVHDETIDALENNSWDDTRAIFARTAESANKCYLYTKALGGESLTDTNKNYVNYYGLIAATYSFAYQEPKDTTDTVPPAYIDKKNNSWYKLWVKDSAYYRFLQPGEKINRKNKYKLVTLFYKNLEKDSQEPFALFGRPNKQVNTNEWIVAKTDMLKMHPWQDGSYNKINATQFGFLESKVLSDITLEAINQKEWENDTITIDKILPLITVMNSKVQTELQQGKLIYQTIKENKTTKEKEIINNDIGSIWNNIIKENSITFNHIFMIVQYEDFDRATIVDNSTQYNTWDDNKICYKDITSSNVYDIKTDNKVKWDQEKIILTNIGTDYIYEVAAADADFIHPSEFQEDAHYYWKENDTIERIYTLDQLLTAGFNVYYSNTYDYSHINYKEHVGNYNVPLYLIDLEWKGGDLINSSSRLYDANYPIQFKVSNLKKNEYESMKLNILDKQTNQIYTTTLILQAESPISINTNLNNGNFWYRYHNNLDETFSTLHNEAMAIETELDQLWNQALVASKYSHYFLPDSWKPQIDKSNNFFANKILLVENKEETQDGKTTNSRFIKLMDTYLPEVKIYSKMQGNEYITRFKKYIASADNNSAISYDKLLENPAWESFALIHKDSEETTEDFLQSLSLVENGMTTYYYAVSGGLTWPNFINEVTNTRAYYDNFTGLYGLKYYLLKKQYQASETYNYEELQKEKLALWKQLYTNYPLVFLERNYKNDKVSSSKELLSLAQLAFKDQQEPELQYNLTIINSADLWKQDAIENIEVPKTDRSNGIKIDFPLKNKTIISDPLRIGEPIKLDVEAYTVDIDDIFNNLNQYLFITDLSYELRHADNIAITVNRIKYQDKLLQSLVKLIR